MQPAKWNVHLEDTMYSICTRSCGPLDMEPDRHSCTIHQYFIMSPPTPLDAVITDKMKNE